jgi:hypothetical protein
MNPYASPDSDLGGLNCKHSVASVTSLALALLGAVLLAYAVLHIRVDRSTRIPVVTYLGPAASWIPCLAFTGWWISVASLMLAVRAMKRKGSRIALAVLAASLSIVNLVGSFLFYGVMMET